MNFLDILIILVGVGALYFGFRKGIIKQLGAILALFAAIAAARLLCHPVGVFLASIFTDVSSTADGTYASDIFGAVVVFVVVYVIVRIAASGVSRMAQTLLLGPIDRILGALFLLLEWFTILSLFLNLWVALWPESSLVSESTLGGGAIARYVVELAPWLLGTLSATAGLKSPL